MPEGQTPTSQHENGQKPPDIPEEQNTEKEQQNKEVTKDNNYFK